jgi:hypothetical protein
VALLALVAPHLGGAGVTSEKTVLVVLATSGSQPYTVTEVGEPCALPKGA